MVATFAPLPAPPATVPDNARRRERIDNKNRLQLTLGQIVEDFPGFPVVEQDKPLWVH